jgi:septum site-determining protein MinD
MKTLAFHSFKGGTGKSYLSSNIAGAFSSSEKVCLLDMDQSAPTLQRLFNLPTRELWLNDYLEGYCEIDEALQQVNNNLYLGMANPLPEAIRAALGKSKNREMQSLKRLLSLKKKLEEDGFKKLILDTSPGYEYSSINSVATADLVGIITTLYRPDMMGSKELIAGLYDPLEKDAFMIINRYHGQKKFEEFKSEVDGLFNNQVFGLKCFCDEAEEIGNTIITLEDAAHPLSDSFLELAQKIEKIS